MRVAAGDEAAAAIEFGTLEPKDWTAASRAALAPVRIGRFVLHGGHDRGAVLPSEIGIEIEAALAFGTGHHGTTQGCLRAIERVAKRRKKRRAPSPRAAGRGERILDIGTGTGVLAIAAARVFRRPVVACDIDPVAVATARANARANRAGAFVRIVHADGTNAPSIRAGAPYDLVLANIVLGPLKLLAKPVARLLAPRATIVLSGLLPEQANAALAAWRAVGLKLVAPRHARGLGHAHVFPLTQTPRRLPAGAWNSVKRAALLDEGQALRIAERRAIARGLQDVLRNEIQVVAHLSLDLAHARLDDCVIDAGPEALFG